MAKAKIPLKSGSPDDFQTPIEALYPLIEFLNKDWMIWECACGKGNLVKGLQQYGFRVIATDIIYGIDFLITEKNIKNFDCIITNPPFSLKDKFLEKCYRLKKPFALLLPLSALGTPKRQKLFKKNGIQLILFDKRLKFEVPAGMNNQNKSWFDTAWYTWGLDLPTELNFVKFKQPPDQTKLEV